MKRGAGARLCEPQQRRQSHTLEFITKSNCITSGCPVRHRLWPVCGNVLVRLGGHHVPAKDIRRRFKRSLAHLLDDYLPLATRWAIWDSRSLPVKRLAISTDRDIEFVRKLIGV
ncbi:MAG: hypothetical protein DME24_19510 [Verrucomicrobia bacterium]|nr:MAG: hypothetical protein DME24_19510 [Verrucomicrobiota bacterium]